MLYFSVSTKIANIPQIYSRAGLNPLSPGPPGSMPPPGIQFVINNFPQFFAFKKGYLLQLFIFKHYLLENEQTMKQTNNYRVRRQIPDEQRRKISEALKGRKKDPQTRKAISRGLKRYWSNVVWEGENNGQAD